MSMPYAVEQKQLTAMLKERFFTLAAAKVRSPAVIGGDPSGLRPSDLPLDRECFELEGLLSRSRGVGLGASYAAYLSLGERSLMESPGKEEVIVELESLRVFGFLVYPSSALKKSGS